MKNCSVETKMIAYLLGPPCVKAKDLWQYPVGNKEPCLIEALRHNKVIMTFERKLESDIALKERIFSTFPHIESFLEDRNFRSEKDSAAFIDIKHIFTQNNIRFLLIKSDGRFPYESDNFDILIEPGVLGKVVKLLNKAGYSERIKTRERHKFLFRNTQTPDVLPLHIHTRVEWEGTQFADSESLWHRSSISDDFGGFLTPSPEDCILITCAHLFFEDHEIKLADLLKIDSKLRNRNVNWEYMFDHADRLHWNDAFHLTLLLMDLVYQNLFEISMLPENVSSKIKAENGHQFQFFKKTMKPFSSGCAPLIIPYVVATYFFLRRTFRESDLTLLSRLKQMDQVTSNVFKEKIVRAFGEG